MKVVLIAAMGGTGIALIVQVVQLSVGWRRFAYETKEGPGQRDR